MKILYDYQAFSQRIGGVSRYNLELMKNLPSGVNYILTPCLSDNAYLKEMGFHHLSILPGNNGKIKQRLYSGYNRMQSLRCLEFGKFDVFHPTYFRPYYLGYTRKHPVVVTVHDLTYFLYPDMLPCADSVKEQMEISCKNADAIICVSEETRQNLLRFIDIDEKKTTKIYLGSSQEIIRPGIRPHARPYILFIGGRKGYKNFQTFLKAYSLMNTKVDLICTGKPFDEEELELISKLGVRERVFQMFVSDKELKNLLCHAICFAYPSIAEGFGLPILEAAQCGCPSIISNILCFHEVAGDSVLYFDPHAVDDITEKMENVISDEDLRRDMCVKAKENLKRFSWRKMANETADLYKSLI